MIKKLLIKGLAAVAGVFGLAGIAGTPTEAKAQACCGAPTQGGAPAVQQVKQDVNVSSGSRFGVGLMLGNNGVLQGLLTAEGCAVVVDNWSLLGFYQRTTPKVDEVCVDKAQRQKFQEMMCYQYNENVRTGLYAQQAASGTMSKAQYDFLRMSAAAMVEMCPGTQDALKRVHGSDAKCATQGAVSGTPMVSDLFSQGCYADTDAQKAQANQAALDAAAARAEAAERARADAERRAQLLAQEAAAQAEQRAKDNARLTSALRRAQQRPATPTASNTCGVKVQGIGRAAKNADERKRIEAEALAKLCPPEGAASGPR